MSETKRVELQAGTHTHGGDAVSVAPDPHGGTPRKLGDGLYRVARGHWLWVKDGVLFLPVGVLHPLILLTSGRPFVAVDDNRGKVRHFIRARHVMEEAPNLAAQVRLIAVKYGCEV